MVASPERVNGPATSCGKGPSTTLVGKGPGPYENHNTRDMDGPEQTL